MGLDDFADGTYDSDKEVDESDEPEPNFTAVMQVPIYPVVEIPAIDEDHAYESAEEWADEMIGVLEEEFDGVGASFDPSDIIMLDKEDL